MPLRFQERDIAIGKSIVLENMLMAHRKLSEAIEGTSITKYENLTRLILWFLQKCKDNQLIYPVPEDSNRWSDNPPHEQKDIF